MVKLFGLLFFALAETLEVYFSLSLPPINQRLFFVIAASRSFFTREALFLRLHLTRERHHHHAHLPSPRPNLPQLQSLEIRRPSCFEPHKIHRSMNLEALKLRNVWSGSLLFSVIDHTQISVSTPAQKQPFHNLLFSSFITFLNTSAQKD